MHVSGHAFQLLASAIKSDNHLQGNKDALKHLTRVDIWATGNQSAH